VSQEPDNQNLTTTLKRRYVITKIQASHPLAHGGRKDAWMSTFLTSLRTYFKGLARLAEDDDKYKVTLAKDYLIFIIVFG